MASTIDRRQALILITSGAISGCLDGAHVGNRSSTPDARPNAGALELENLTDFSEQVTVTVRKISNSSDGGPSNQPPPEQPVSEDIWHRTRSYAVGPNERRIVSDFITETGTYFIEVSGPDDEAGNEWLGLSKAYGGGVTGRYLSVVISYQSLRVSADGPE